MLQSSLSRKQGKLPVCPTLPKEQLVMKSIKNHRHTLLFVCALILSVAGLTAAAFQKKSPATPVDPLIAGFKKSYPASVSDAVELVTGKNGTMWHDMKQVNGTPIVGRAVTSLV